MKEAKAASQPSPDRKPKLEAKGKGKLDVIDLCDSSDDDELWENEDELVEGDDNEARDWMEEDMKTWEDDCVIIDGPGDTATTSGSSKSKPVASKSSGACSPWPPVQTEANLSFIQASKRGRTGSDSDGPSKKAVKPKSSSGPAPNPSRTWRATSEERDGDDATKVCILSP